jgi:Putative 2OG-Fe(II) oxygenase
MTELNKIKYAHFAYLAAANVLNEQILDGFERYKDKPEVKKTHLFADRYENIYIDREQIPEIKQVIEQAIKYVAEILAIDAKKLQCGFWFNSMQPGDVTQPHTHDDDDELMSGVYYIEVPKNSGQLIIGVAGHHSVVEPEAGKYVFFKPNVIHEVTENQSAAHRLSIGMNFGLKDESKLV